MLQGSCLRFNFLVLTLFNKAVIAANLQKLTPQDTRAYSSSKPLEADLKSHSVHTD